MKDKFHSIYKHEFSDYYTLNLKKILNINLVNSLREVYLLDKPLFFRLREELLTKGIILEDISNSSLFPELEFGAEVIVGYNENNNKYEFSKHEKFNNYYKEIKYENKKNLIGTNLNALSSRVLIPINELCNLLRMSGFLIKGNLSTDKTIVQMLGDNQYKSGINENLSIDKIFNERKFEKIREFCISKNISHTRDITKPVIDDFSNQKGIGQAKIKELTHYLDVVNSNSFTLFIENRINYIFNNTILKICNKNEYLQLLDSMVDNYETYFIKNDFEQVENYFMTLVNESIEKNMELMISKIKSTNYYNIFCNEIVRRVNSTNQEIDFNYDSTFSQYLYEIKSYEELNRINNISSYFDRFDDALIHLVEDMKPQKRYVYEERMIKTLEELGNEFDLTRERIRQIETRTTSVIIQTFERYYIFIEDVIKSKRISDPGILYSILIGKNGYQNFFLHLLVDLDLVIRIRSDYFTKYMYSLCLEYIEELLVDDPIIVEHNLEDYFDREIIEAVAQTKKYKTSKNLLYRNGTIIERIELIAQQSSDSTISIDQPGFLLIEEKSISIFGDFNYSYTKNDIRSLISTIERSTKLVRVDKYSWKFFCDYNEIGLDENIKLTLKKYIDNGLDNNNVVFVKNILLDLEEYLIKYNINNKYFLSSVIRVLFSDEYSIGRGNTQSITRIDDKITYSEHLISILNEHKNGISKSEMISKLQWSEPKLSQSIMRTPEIISFLDEDRRIKYMLYENLEFGENQKNELRDLLEYYKRINCKYVSMDEFLVKLVFESTNRNYYTNKGFLNSRSLISEVIIREFPKYKKSNLGHLLFFEEVLTVEDILNLKFTNLTTISEMEYYLENIGYRRMTIDDTLKVVLRNDLFRYTSKDEIINNNFFDLRGIDTNRVTDLIENEILKKGFFNPYSNDELYSIDIVNSQYVWTENLVIEIGKNLGFHEDILINEIKNRVSVLFKNETDSLLLLIETNYSEPVLFTELYKKLELENTISIRRFKNILENSSKLRIDEYNWLLRR
ncbi:sigma factor-like helix-turn-helix DNA-binding protein [Erysipelothrix rhusiopathiae]|uniref:sigma factor-like helix-turn-helix DNA-binding protein n=1 Tax=Erysipelothrix rhusiopathiae TaxID=1648 RepID=UPI00200A8463|nr:sigma factor-like helix-turn-helix DNA-binding protein [Erysipelothrix rhusiopathiae]MDV7679703.1 hypothetical protein [Erysipelothrix rhusiopathiae]UPU39004.1 hypothetical protein MX850_10665 [Erysipelothrix sp. Poltava]